MDGSILSVGESFQRTDSMGSHTGTLVGELIGFSQVGRLFAVLVRTAGGEVTCYVKLDPTQLQRHSQKERVLNPISVPL